MIGMFSSRARLFRPREISEIRSHESLRLPHELQVVDDQQVQAPALRRRTWSAHPSAWRWSHHRCNGRPQLPNALRLAVGMKGSASGGGHALILAWWKQAVTSTRLTSRS